MNPKEFKEDMKVKTTVFMSAEDTGDVDIPVGTKCTVQSEHVDEEELVLVHIHGAGLIYLPQNVLEPC